MTLKPWSRLGVALAFAVVPPADHGFARGTAWRGAEERPQVGFFVSDFTRPGLKGTPVTLSAFRGKTGRGALP